VIIIPAERIVREGVPAALAPINDVAQPPQAVRPHAYLTIDIDVLDPGAAPGTGYPEPGGINYYQLKEALLDVAARFDVVAFDVCEVDPVYDAAGVTPRIASKLILDLLGAVFAR
jgi:agmatinase